MGWEIRSDRPIPTTAERRANRRGYQEEWPFEKMAVGESVDIPINMSPAAISRILTVAKRTGKHFVRRTEMDKLIIWRDK